MAPAPQTSPQPTRRAFLAASLLAPAVPVLAAPVGGGERPRVLAGVMAGFNEPGGAMERRAMGLLAPGTTGEVSWMPWARAYLTAGSGNCVIFPLARTPERETAWHWLAPLAQDRVVLVLSREAFAGGTGMARLRALRTGAIRSDFIVGRLRAHGFENVDVAPTEGANARKMALGRIDAWATVASVAAAVQQREGLPEGSRIVPLEAAPFAMWLAASRDVQVARVFTGSRSA